MGCFIRLFLCIAGICPLITNAQQNGNYFKSSEKEQRQNTVDPWKYRFTPSDSSGPGEKIGTIFFWRTVSLYDNTTKKYWKPSISYDVYNLSDVEFVEKKSAEIKSRSNCDSIHQGGEIEIVNTFLLLNTAECVSCLSGANVDYCRHIITLILAPLRSESIQNWNELLKRLPVPKGKPRN